MDVETLKSQIKFAELQEAAMVDRCITVATHLRIADQLIGGSLTIDELAARVGADPGMLYRIMRLLSSWGIFSESGGKTFALSSNAQLLRSDHSLSIASSLASRRCADLAAPCLIEAVRENKNPFLLATGMGFWEYLSRNEELNSSFDEEMRAIAANTSIPAFERVNWAGSAVVADVGGGTGRVLASILRAHSHLRGVLVDRAEAVMMAKQELRGLNCTFNTDDIRSAVPAADTYILSHVLHNWSDGDCLTILRVIRRALLGRGRLLIAELMMPGTQVQHPAKWADVAMLLLFGEARERTEAELKDLLEKAGWNLAKVNHGRGVAIVEAIPN